jgi:ribosomal protein S18 acetylase RimI-like enzyme
MNAQREHGSEIVHRYDDGMTIVTFDARWREDFKRLNVAWLERYFTVESIDARVLGNPEDEILAPGGEILFALSGVEVVGTVGLKAEGEGEFELTKMAVDEHHQGRGYGQRLLESAIDVARQRGKTRVVLYTQKVLAPAITLYRKNGFVELECFDRKYARCDTKMERRVDNG